MATGCLHLFIPFFFSCYVAVISTILSSRSVIHSSTSVILHWFVVYCSSLFACYLVLLDFGKHFMHLLHSVSEILGHLHYHYSEFFFWKVAYLQSFLGGSDGKESTCNAGDPGSIPGLGRSCGEGNGNPLLYSCMENPMDRGACQATVHSVAKSWTWLKRLSTHACLSPIHLIVFLRFYLVPSSGT